MMINDDDDILNLHPPSISWIAFAIPHLFSVVDNNASYHLMIEGASLVIKYYQNEKEVMTQNTNLPVNEGQWYHLVLSQNANRLNRSQSSLTLSLNGNCNFECPCMYPAFSTFPKMYIGTRGVDLAYTNLPTAFTELAGEIGTVYLFNRALSTQQSRGLYLLGSNYRFNFENMAIDHRSIFQELGSEDDRKAVKALCDGSLTSSLLVNLSACVQDRERKAVLDNTPPRYRASKWGSTKETKDIAVQAVNGELLPGTYIFSTRQIPAVLDSLGGVALVLPLLTQLDLMAPNAQEGDFTRDEEFTEKVLTLLSAAVETPSAQQFMTQQGGFEIMAYLLQKATPGHRTTSLLNHLIALMESRTLPKEVHKQVFKAFLENSAMWVFCSVDVQIRIYDYIVEILVANENPELVACVRAMGMQGFLHILRYFYSETPVEIGDELKDERVYMQKWLALDETVVHPLSDKLVVAKRLEKEDILRVRESVFRVINQLVKGMYNDSQ